MTQEELCERLNQLYDLYRTTLLSKKYYGCRLEELRNLNRNMEIAVAVGSSSAIAAWGIWGKNTGGYIWAFITGIATILATLKPILQLPKQIERYSKLQVGYADLYYDLKRAVEAVAIEQALSGPTQEAIAQAKDRYKHLSLEDDPKPRRGLVQKCEEEVRKEVPVEDLPAPKIVSSTPTSILRQ